PIRHRVTRFGRAWLQPCRYAPNKNEGFSPPGRPLRQQLLLALIALTTLVFLFPTPSHAYAGPGAGFAVLSSFWTLFVAFLYSAYAFLTWPLRHLLRLLRRRKSSGKAQIKGMRRGTPFWYWLGKAGIFSSVIRVPVTFPPEKFSGVLLSGMCVPDLKGSQGTFCFCTTRGQGDKFREGGVRIPIERN